MEQRSSGLEGLSVQWDFPKRASQGASVPMASSQGLSAETGGVGLGDASEEGNSLSSKASSGIKKVAAQSPFGELRKAQLSFRAGQIAAPTGLRNVFDKAGKLLIKINIFLFSIKINLPPSAKIHLESCS